MLDHVLQRVNFIESVLLQPRVIHIHDVLSVIGEHSCLIGIQLGFLMDEVVCYFVGGRGRRIGAASNTIRVLLNLPSHQSDVHL